MKHFVEKKNILIEFLRYFTSLRQPSYTVCTWCRFLLRDCWAEANSLCVMWLCAADGAQCRMLIKATVLCSKWGCCCHVFFYLLEEGHNGMHPAEFRTAQNSNTLVLLIWNVIFDKTFNYVVGWWKSNFSNCFFTYWQSEFKHGLRVLTVNSNFG